MKSILIHSDGGSRGNPGKSAIAYTVEVDNKLVKEHARVIGIATNNEAEHLAIQEALIYILNNFYDPAHIECMLDSELVVYQLQGIYKIKNIRLKQISNATLQTIMSLRNRGIYIGFTAIPRELNARADKLLNIALDGMQ